MLWVDYREKLGIAFSDIDKFALLQSKIVNYLNANALEIPYTVKSFFAFCNMSGTKFDYDYDPYIELVIEEIDSCKNLNELLSIYIAFVNTFAELKTVKLGRRQTLISVLTIMMQESKIGFEIQYDEQENQYFVFPQGAAELDNALVSEPLEWLQDYPLTQKTFVMALKQYSDGDYIRDAADNFRKALEEFLKEFFQNTKNLENNIKEVGAYLKAQGGENEITSILVNIMSCYKTLNDKTAKHHDKVNKKFLEFLMYQTGLFIRMLIVVKRSEETTD